MGRPTTYAGSEDAKTLTANGPLDDPTGVFKQSLVNRQPMTAGTTSKESAGLEGLQRATHAKIS